MIHHKYNEVHKEKMKGKKVDQQLNMDFNQSV